MDIEHALGLKERKENIVNEEDIDVERVIQPIIEKTLKTSPKEASTGTIVLQWMTEVHIFASGKQLIKTFFVGKSRKNQIKGKKKKKKGREVKEAKLSDVEEY